MNSEYNARYEKSMYVTAQGSKAAEHVLTTVFVPQFVDMIALGMTSSRICQNVDPGPHWHTWRRLGFDFSDANAKSEFTDPMYLARSIR